MANTPQFHANLLITADTKQAMQSLESLQNSITKLVSNSIKGTGLGGGITKELQEAQAAAAKLQVSLHQATNLNTGKLDLTRFSDSLKKSNLDLQDVYKHLSSFGTEGQKAFLQLTNSIASAEVPLKRTSKMFDDLWTTMKNTAKWQLTSSMMHGFVGAVQSAYGYAKDLNKSLNDIRIVTGYNTDQMAKFAKTANDAAKALSTTTTRYTDAALIYYQQGLPESDIKARTEATIKMANVTGEAAKDVSNYMTAIWNNFDNGTKSLEYYADVMTALGAATASSTDEIAAGLEKFAAVSETVGLSYEYATAALATITAETRQNADVVGNALKTLFSRLQGLNLGETMEDGTTLNKYSAALEKVGVSIKDTSGQIKDMDLILSELGTKWNTLSKDTQIATAQTVAGVRQYTQLIALMDNWDVFKDNLSIAKNASGTLNEQAEIYAESWEAASNRVRAAWEGIYDSVLDDDFFISVTDGFAEILKGIENVTDAMGGMRGVAFGLGAILTKVFGKQMAQSLSNAAYGVKGLFGYNQKEGLNFQKTALSLALDSSATTGNDVEVVKNSILQEQLNLKAQILEMQSNLTKQEQLEVEALLSINKKHGDRVVLAKQEWATATEAVNRNNVAIIPELRRFYGDNYNFEEHFIKPTQEIDKWAEDLVKGKTALIEASKIEDEKQRKSAQRKAFDFFSPHLRSAFDSQISPKQYKDYSDYMKYIEESNDLESYNDFFEEIISDFITKKATDMVDRMRIDDPERRNQEIELFRQQYTTRRNRAESYQTSIQEEELFNKKSKYLENELKSLQNRATGLSTGIVSLTNSFANLGFALSSIEGIGNIINDETLTSWEKFSSIVTTLSMTLPAVLSGVGEFTSSINSISSGIKAIKQNKIIDALTDIDNGNSKYTRKEALELILNKKNLQGKAQQDLISAEDAARTSIMSSIGVFIKYATVIAAVAAVIALVVKAHQEMYENSPEGQLEKAREKAAELNEVLNDTLQISSDLKKSIEDYDGAVKSLEACTKGTQEWRDSLQEANDKALDLLNTFGHLGLEYEKDPSTGLITVTNSEKIQQEMDKRTTAANIAKINGDQDVLEKGYEVDLSNYADKIYDYLSDGSRSTYIKRGIATAEYEIEEYFKKNFNDFQQLPEKELRSIIGDKIKNDFYDSSVYGSSDEFKNSLDNIVNHVVDIVTSTNDLTEALNANTEVNKLRQENELAKYLDKDEYREGELAVTNAIYQNAIKAEEEEIVETLTAQAQINKELSGDAETLWNEFVQIKGLEGIELANNAVIGDKNSRIIKGQMVQDDGSLKEVEYLATTIAETIAAYRALENAGANNTTALNLLNTGGKALGSFAANGNLENASIADVDKILSIINNNNIFKQQLEGLFGVEQIEELKKQAEEYANTINSIWENNIYGSLDETDLNQFKQLGVSASQEILKALNETFKYGGQETQDLLIKIFSDAGDKAGEVAKIFNDIDWSSGDAMDQFITELRLLGIELKSVDPSEFEAAMAAIADSLPIDDVDTLINKIKELYGIIKDVDKGSIVDEDTYKKLIEAGANPDDFIETSDGYLATKDVKSSDVTNHKDDFNKMSGLYYADVQQKQLNTILESGYSSFSDYLNSSDITDKQALENILNNNHGNQELKDYLGIGNLSLNELTENDITTALNKYSDLLSQGQAGRLESSWYNQQEQLTAGNLTEMSQMNSFDLSTEATQNALHAYAIEGGEEYAGALKEYQTAMENIQKGTKEAIKPTEEFYKRIKQIETNKAANNIQELYESLDTLKGNQYEDAIDSIHQNLESVFGEVATRKYVENHQELIKEWYKGNISNQDLLDSMLFEEGKYAIKIPVEMDTSQMSETINEINSLLTEQQKEVVLQCRAEGDFQGLISQLLTAGASAEQVAIYLASIGATTLDPEGFDAILKAMEVMAKFMKDGLGSVDPSELASARETIAGLGFGGQVPGGDVSAEMKQATGGGGGGSGKSTGDAIDDALEKRRDRKKDLLKLKQEGLNPEDASKYYQEEIDMLEEEQKLLEKQIDTWEELLDVKVKEFNAKYPEFELKLDDQGHIANLDAVLNDLKMKWDYAQFTNDKDLMNELDDIYEALQGPLGLQENIDENVALIAQKEKEQAQLALEDIVNRIDWRIKQIDYQIERLNYYQEKLLIQAHGNKQTIEAMLEGFQYQEQEMLQLFEKGATLRQGIDELRAAKAQYPDYAQMFDEQILEYQSDLIDVNLDILNLRAEMEELVQNVLDLALDEMDIQNERIERYVSMLDRFQNIIDLSGRSILDQSLKIEIGATKLDTLINKMSISKQTMEGLAEATAKAQKALENRAADGDETSVSFWENQVEMLERELEKAQDDFLANWEETLEAAADIFDMRVELTVQTLEQALSPFSSLELLEDRYNKEKIIQEQYLSDATKLYELNKLNREINMSIQDENDLLAKSKLRDLQSEILALQKAGVEMSQYDLDVLQKKYDLRLAEIALMEAQNSKTSMRLIRDAAGNWTYAYDADEQAIEDATQKYEDAIYEMDQLAIKYIDETSEELIAIQKEFADAIGGIDRNAADYQEQLLAIQEHYMERYSHTLNEFKKATQDAGLTIHDTQYGMIMDLYSFEDAQNRFTENSDKAITDLMINYKDWQKVVEKTMNVAGTSWDSFGADTDATLESLQEHISALCDEISKLVDVLMEYVATAIGMVEEWQAKYSKQVDSNLAANEAYIDGGGGSRGGGGGKMDPDMRTDFNRLMNELANGAKTVQDLRGNTYTAADLEILAQKRDAKLLLSKADYDILHESDGTPFTSAETQAAQAKLTSDIVMSVEEALNLLGGGKGSNINYNNTNTRNYSYSSGVYNPKSGWCSQWVSDVMHYSGNGSYVGGDAWVAVLNNNPTAYNGQRILNGTMVGSKSGTYGHNGIYQDGYIYSTTPSGNSIQKMTISEWEKTYGKLWVSDATNAQAGNIAKDVYLKEQGVTQQAINEALALLSGYDTGGYTGAWGPDGRLALLHEKELVLNKMDTSNILSAVEIARSIDDTIHNLTASTNWKLQNLLGYANPMFEDKPIEQTVQINAEFPSVTDQYEIQEALANLSNNASQYLNIRRNLL